MPFAKFKIVFDPSCNPLDTGMVKKIAFVELRSFQDQNRVLKWQDLYYRGSRRVMIEAGDFGDFKRSISFNQEHEAQLQRVEQDFLAGRNRPDHGGFPRTNRMREHPPLHHEENLPMLRPQNAAAAPPSPAKHKSNPFGNAKPVDVLARQHEIEKKLITINHTTIKTPGLLPGDKIDMPHAPPPKQEQPEPVVEKPQDLSMSPSSEKSGLTPAPIPSSVYGQKQSLADLLSSKNDSDSVLGHTTGKAATRKSVSTPKPPVKKPTILKKKQFVVSTPAQQLELAKMTSEEQREVDIIRDTEPTQQPDTNEEAPPVETVEVTEEKVEKNVSAAKDESKIRRPHKESPKEFNKEQKPKELKREPREIRDPREPRPPKETKKRRDSRPKVHEVQEGDKESKPEQTGDVPSKEKTQRDISRLHSISERNKAFASLDRPDFKKHLSEMTQALEEREKPRAARGGKIRRRGGRNGALSDRVNKAGEVQADSKSERAELKDRVVRSERRSDFKSARTDLKPDEDRRTGTSPASPTRQRHQLGREDNKKLELRESNGTSEPKNGVFLRDNGADTSGGESRRGADRGSESSRGADRGRGRGRGRGGRGGRGRGRGNHAGTTGTTPPVQELAGAPES